MSFRVKMKPTSEIKARLGIDPNGRVQKFFTHTCRIHIDKYVPYSDGNLAETVREDTKHIRYLSPYAHYMYEGKVMGPNVPIKRKGTDEIVAWYSPIKPKYYTGAEIKYNKSMHPLAGPRWDKRMWSAEKEKVLKEVEEFIRWSK